MVMIEERTFNFALLIIDVYKFLKMKNEYVLSKQLLRSGTSIGANVEEAEAGQSKKDFIAKMSIASKEARESRYWIRLLTASGYLDEYKGKDQLFKEINDIVNILTKIVKTSQQNLHHK